MKKYIERIIENGKPDDMYCLSEILVDLLYKIKEVDYKLFKHYETKLKGMANDYKIDEELAKEIVSDMKPLGEHWSIDTVQSVTETDGHDIYDKYVVMNSLVNDYQTIIASTDTETYVKMMDAWIDDVDGREHKVWWYFIK